MVNELCKEHSGLEEKIMSIFQELQALRGLIKWSIGIFITISIAITGFLWSGQNTLWSASYQGDKEIVSEMAKQDRENDQDRQAIKIKLSDLDKEITAIRTRIDIIYKGGKRYGE